MHAFLRSFVFVVIAMKFSMPDSAVALPEPNRLALITLDGATYDSSRLIIKSLEGAGLRVRHIFPPNHLIGEASKTLLDAIRGAPGVTGLETASNTGTLERAGSPSSNFLELILVRLSCLTASDGEFHPATGMLDPRPCAADQLPLAAVDPPIGCDSIRLAQLNPNMNVPKDYL